LKAIDRMLSVPKGSLLVGERATEEEWIDFFDEVERARMLVAIPELWVALFCQGIAGILPVAQRVSLPGELNRMIWVCGDATPERIGCVDWTFKKGTVIEISQMWPALKAVVAGDVAEDPDAHLLISLAELITYVSMACARGKDWKGRLVLYVSDNTNVVGWLGRDGFQFSDHLDGHSIRTQHDQRRPDPFRNGWCPQSAQREKFRVR
jgi:hypothetical protein